MAPSADWVRTATASLVIGVVGSAVLWQATDGFRALTSEQARRRAIAAVPRSIPHVELEDQDGQPFTLEAYRGRPLIVDFVYTQCHSICTLLSTGFQRIDGAERWRPAGDGQQRLQLVSISFDPLDTPAQLREYATRYRADGRTWRFARVRDSRDLAPLLRVFGIVVIRDAGGDFQHNAAVHVLNTRGQLARVLDPGVLPAEVARAVAAIRQ